MTHTARRPAADSVARVPRDLPTSRRRRLPPAVRDAAAVAVIAAVVALLPLGYASYDQTFALIWGRELLDGLAPSYDVPLSPTPHPLATGLAAFAGLLGAGTAERVLGAIAVLALACAIWTIVLLGRELGGWAAGAVAALAFGTSALILSRTTAAMVDVHVLALVLLAVLLEVRRPRAGLPVLAVLAVAGLQRPEAWALSGLYWLWLLPAGGLAGRARLLLVVAAAPAIWMLSDLATTGDPLFSFVDTRDATVPGDPAAGVAPASHDGASARGSVTETARVMFEILRTLLRAPMLAGAVAGAAIAFVLMRRRAATVLVAATAWLGTIGAFGVISLPIADRFLFPGAALLAVLYGVAAAGWADGRSGDRAGRWRRAWIALGVVLLAALAATAPSRIDDLGRLSDKSGEQVRASDDLRALLETPAAQRVLDSCGVLYVPNYRLVPFAAWGADRPVATVRAAPAGGPQRGAFVAALTPEAVEGMLEIAGGRRLAPVAAPEGFRRQAANRSWQVLARGC